MSELLDCVEVLTGPEPSASVVWLHGLGADGHDFEPIVPLLGLDQGPGVRFVFPHAPMRPVTINMGMTMPAWYDVRDLELRRDQDHAAIEESAQQVERLLEREKQRGIPAERMVMAGFSQGGAIAFHVGLRHAEPLAGLMVLSAYVLLQERLDGEASEANLKTPILQCHGELDPLVPVSLGQTSAELLKQRGYDLDWRTYPVEHGVHPQEIADVGQWLGKLLGER